MTLAALTADDFTARMQETFALSVPGMTVEVRLVEVEKLGGASVGRRPFSLRFSGPSQPILSQATYRIENAAMGAIEVFLVPLGPRDGGMCYEAVFT
jgi:hypothetical protein